MKCYSITSRFSDCTRLEWADTASKARAMAAHTDEFYDVEFIDLQVRRERQFDGRESNPPTWEELVMQHGWSMECDCGNRAGKGESPEFRDDRVVKCDNCRKQCENCKTPIPDDRWCCDGCFPKYNGEVFIND